jgi:hypothetical protein
MSFTSRFPIPLQNMVDLQVIDLEANGVVLVSTLRTEFDSLVQSIAPGWATSLQEVKPYVAIIHNASQHKVVAFKTVLRVKWSDGTTSRYFSEYKYPDALSGQRLGTDGISPGQRRLAGIAVGFELAKFTPEFEASFLELFGSIKKEFASAKAAEVELDAVIFDNGSLIGPDSGPETLKDNFLAYVQAKQSVYRTILERIDHGMRGDEAFQSPRRSELSLYPKLAWEEAQT